MQNLEKIKEEHQALSQQKDQIASEHAQITTQIKNLKSRAKSLENNFNFICGKLESTLQFLSLNDAEQQENAEVSEVSEPAA